MKSVFGNIENKHEKTKLYAIICTITYIEHPRGSRVNLKQFSDVFR